MVRFAASTCVVYEWKYINKCVYKNLNANAHARQLGKTFLRRGQSCFLESSRIARFVNTCDNRLSDTFLPTLHTHDFGRVVTV